MADLRVPDLNKVIIAGRLTRDPELRYTTSNMPYCKLGVANTRYYKGKDGNRNEDTTFVDITLWGPSAEWVGERLKKGRAVLVEGRLSTSEWEDRESGQKRSKMEINAQRVTPLEWDDDGRGGSGGGGGGGSYSNAPAPRREESSRPQPRVIEEPIPEDDIPF